VAGTAFDATVSSCHVVAGALHPGAKLLVRGDGR
jgi:hypothetical protein